MPLFGPPNVEKLETKGNVKGLIKALGYEKDAGTRQAAADALGKIGNEEGVAPLIAALRDEEKVRQAAAEALEKIGAPAVGPLVAALKDPKVRQLAAEALEKIGAPAVEPLVAALKDTRVSQLAAEALEKIGAPAVGPLVTALKDTKVNHIAIRILGQIGDSRAVEPLVAILEDDQVHTRNAAAEALDKIGWQPDQSEAGAAYWIAMGQWGKCVELGELAVRPLVAALRDKSKNARQAASGALEKIGLPAVEPLVTALQDKGWSVRQAAAETLGQIGDSRAMEPLIATLNDKSAKVREATAKALKKLDSPAMESLTAALQDKDSGVRRAVAGALGQIGDAHTVEPLIAALQDKDSGVRRAAAEALEQIGDARVVEPLIAALQDKDSGVRRAAAEALGQIGDAHMVEPLVASLHQGDVDACDSIVEVLRKTGVKAGVVKHRDVILSAFFVRAAGGPMVVSTADQSAWIRRLRSEFRLPKAKVKIYEQDQWDAPSLDSVDDEAIRRNFPAIRSAIQKVLLAQGVPATELNLVTNDITKLSNPLTRLVTLVVKHSTPLSAEYQIGRDDGSVVVVRRTF
jgi:HEAT repeat protein